MSVLPVGFGSAAGGGGYQIERSLRFNSADSAYLNRTPGSATDRQKWTWSSWVKLGSLTINQMIFSAGATSGANVYAYWNTTNTLSIRFDQEASGNVGVTAAVNRDPSAWYHVVFALDTTQATAANRVKIYINGVQQDTTGSTFPSQNFNTAMNNNVAHSIGRRGYDATSYASFLLSEIVHVDGQQLAASSFGETDSATGVWKPKAYSGTYGTNGFYLNFSDNSGTTSTTLGKDSSGNGNNWTPNNFSVTAGAGNDSLVDSPTAYGTDTGAGGSVRGNYATANPLDTNSALLFANGNLDLSNSSGTGVSCRSTFQMPSGKWYWEFTVTNSGTYVGAGIGTNSATTASYVGDSSVSYGYLSHTGNKYNSGAATSYGATFTTNDVIGISFDADAGTLVFYKNGVSQGTAFSSLTGGIYLPMFSCRSGSISVNFGQRAFAYTAPSGFKALCTQNLPTPTIGATSTTQANDYFNVILWSGNNSYPRALTGVGFAPDLVWVKSRTNAYSHVLYDSVRGTGTSKSLYSNETSTEGTNSANANLTSFDADGFTVGSTSGTNILNTNSGVTYVGWNWNAGGSNATNTSGTITSTVRANTTSGFSIVTYTGNGSGGATVGHGLGASPSWIIIKSRSNATNWMVWTDKLTTNYALEGLNTTGAEVSGGSPSKYIRAVSSTTFTIGDDVSVNQSASYTYVAYCFAPVAGYSAFGSYTGNGSADGPFVYTGFRPAWVLVKYSSTTSYWIVFDNKRNTYNLTNNGLQPNDSAAENSNLFFVDFLSNGFKARDGGGLNGSGQTAIYAAFAESPFKYSLAR